jgi:hypothetical protein
MVSAAIHREPQPAYPAWLAATRQTCAYGPVLLRGGIRAKARTAALAVSSRTPAARHCWPWPPGVPIRKCDGGTPQVASHNELRHTLTAVNHLVNLAPADWQSRAGRAARQQTSGASAYRHFYGEHYTL